MAKKKFLVNIDLNLNQLINTRAENGTGFTTGGVNSKGRLMYDTSTSRVLYDTGSAIETIANLNDVTGLLDFHGGYNALTNTPNLVNPPSGTTLKGDFYIVTVAGTFYGTALEIGDSLFASVDNPTTLSGWVIVQANVVYATETIAGIILLATQTEVNTGTNNSKAVTPLTLATYVANTRQNIYNTDGTLTANRNVNIDNKTLTYNGNSTAEIVVNMDNGAQTSGSRTTANYIYREIYNPTLGLHTELKIENGNASLKVYNQSLTINRSLVVNQFGTRINSIYYLPNVDGTAGQVMTTDGAGNLSWGNSSSVNIYNSNGSITSNRTVGFGIKNLSFEGAGGTFKVFNEDFNTGKQSSITNNLNSNVIQVIEEFGVNAQIEVFAPQILQTVINIENDSYTTQTANGWGFGIKTFGTTIFSISADAFGFNINNQYSFPKVDGTAGQVLTTNGAGAVSWGTGSGGSVNIYNTNGTLTANRTVTIDDKNLTFQGQFGTISLRQENSLGGDLSQITNTIGYNLIRISNTAQSLESSINQQQTVIINSVTNDIGSCVQNLTAFGIETQIFDTFNTVVAFRLDVSALGLRINNVYTLPKVDGTAGQVLTTNGSGAVSWATSSSTVNIYNTDGTLTANRTVTINGRVLNFAGDVNSTFSVNLIDPTTETFSIIDNTINRILNGVGNNSSTVYNTVDITTTQIITTAVSGTQSSTITSTPTTITDRVQALGQSCQTTLTTSGFRINNVYTLPKVDGTAGQVLTTNGTGTVTWGTGSGGGNIYNTDGTLTANRTVTLNNLNLTFSGVGTNGITSFSRSDGAGSQTNYDIRYDFFNLVSNTTTKDTSILITPDQIINGVSDATTLLSTNFNQFTTAFRFFVKNNSNVINSLAIEENGININSAYTIPKVDGTAGQVLTTNGSGVVTWGAGGVSTDIWKLNPNETYRGVSFNNNSTTIVSDGGVVASATASTLAQSVSGSNFANKQVRLRYYASVVSAGRYTGLRGSALLWFIGGGFRYVCDFNISDTAYSNGTQQFYGLANQTADLNYGTTTGILVSTLLNVIGVGNDTNDANLQIFHNDATGTCTKIDLGSGFPANRTAGAVSTTVYEIQLLNLPATTSIQYRVVNKETGAIATGTLTTNLPDATLGLNFFASRCMATLGSVTGSGQFDLSKLGVYSIL
jgi:hypothetical protein